MPLSIVRRWFVGRRAQPGDRRKPRARLRLEGLEGRDLMSWTAVPATFQWAASTSVGFNSNARSGTATVSNNEVDVYNFVAPRSGTYTFTAGRYGSQVDTVAGLYRWNGDRVAGNNNYGGSTDSRFTAYLTGGVRYAFAVTNYTGSSTGGYRWSITGPPLAVQATNNAGSGIETAGFADLVGNTLSVTLTGSNRSNWYYYDHRINVYLLDGSGNAIHSGSWSLTFRTGGTFVAGLPSWKIDTASWDLSGWDLRNVRSMRIVVR